VLDVAQVLLAERGDLARGGRRWTARRSPAAAAIAAANHVATAAMRRAVMSGSGAPDAIDYDIVGTDRHLGRCRRSGCAARPWREFRRHAHSATRSTHSGGDCPPHGLSLDRDDAAATRGKVHDAADAVSRQVHPLRLAHRTAPE
jgi:hypothetical protein